MYCLGRRNFCISPSEGSIMEYVHIHIVCFCIVDCTQIDYLSSSAVVSKHKRNWDERKIENAEQRVHNLKSEIQFILTCSIHKIKIYVIVYSVTISPRQRTVSKITVASSENQVTVKVANPK